MSACRHFVVRIFLVFLTGGIVAPLTIGAAQAASTKANPLGLPRLNTADPARLAKGKYDEDALNVPAGAAGARREAQRGIEYLGMDGGAAWSRPLRGSARDVVFVSFCVNVSVGTELNIAGAVLRVGAAQQAGKAEVAIATSSARGAPRARGFQSSLESYNGKSLAALPVLTVRIDPAAGVWDLFVGTYLHAYGLPLGGESQNAARHVSIRAGAQGAHLCGLVVADDNPLFVDANANGIADSFETARARAPLPAQAPAAKRNALAKASRAAQEPKQGSVLSGRRPVPDRVAQSLPPGR
ncbi:MAG: hypothetical protein ACREH8_16980 [Opitutaceae bacterium]